MNLSRELARADETLFWYWISERHAIYLRRKAGQPKPWTTDPILQQFKFTNPFRENDRGTVWLRENFLIPHREDELELLAFNICWYRMFNWWGTGELLGWQTEWDREGVQRTLEHAHSCGKQVFTGAHIVYSRPGLSKIDAIEQVCYDFWRLRDRIADVADDTKSLESVFDLLKTVDSVGGFMAYEMVSDMRHTRLLEDATDIMTWANPGPGCRRGLQRLGLPHSPDWAAINSMQYLLARAHYSSAMPWDTLTDHRVSELPVFEMRDIEHSLCEFDKYARVKFNEGQPRSRYPGV